MISVLIWLPLLGGAVAALTASRVADSRRVGAVSLVFSMVTLAVAIYFVAAFDRVDPGLQWRESAEWIPSLGIHYELGVDGLNLFMLLLTAAAWVAATAWSMFKRRDRPAIYYGLLALAETAVLGVFAAQDLALFVIFFDLMLVPFYFLIGMYGGKDRIAATQRMIIYTLTGSLLMLAAAVATGIIASEVTGELSFAFQDLVNVRLPRSSQYWIFLLFALAFLVKMPLVPFQGWMPAAYTQAPLPVVALLSGVVAKVAAYGFLKIALPLFPDASAHFQELILVLAVVAILWGSIMAFTRNNLRLIVGYSSISQLGFITAGIFALNVEGAQGSVLQMVNHGVVTIALFLIVAILYERCGSEDLRDMGGAAFRAPVLAALFLIVTMAALAIPGSANFIAEFTILLGVFESKMALAIVASAAMAFAAVYMLRMFQGAMHGKLRAEVNSRDLTLVDGVLLVPLVLVIIALAIYPQFVFVRTDPTVKTDVTAVGGR